MCIADVVKLAIVLALACGCRTPAARQPRQHELVGEPAPAFALPSVGAAGEISLASLKGRVVVVDFWATWCTPCEAALPHLDAWQRQYAARGLAIVGISGDDASDIARFAATRDIAFALVHDEADTTASAYRIAGLPTVVVIDRSGIVRYVDVGGKNFGAIEAVVARLL